ncbi:MAG: VWA domain-containing protein [Chloroflexota bacterium]|nr:VWA domain-containing protein [Chloroflexota bacterium]
MPENLTLHTTWGRDPLPAAGDGQVAYLLLDVGVGGTPDATPAQLPLNLTLVLDHSGSMSGPKLTHLKEAVTRIIDELTPQDTLAIIVFDEHAKVIVPAGPVDDPTAMQAAVAAIREAGGTQMSSGLKAGLEQARQTSSGTVSRIILLTDGQTWGDADECERLAGEAGQAGIPISAFGVGADEDWSVSLLDKIAEQSHGQADYIAQPADTLASFRGTVQTMQRTAVKGAVLTLQLAAGVNVRTIYRINPMIGRVKLAQTDPLVAEVTLGDLGREGTTAVLAELLVPPRKPGQYRIVRAAVRAADSVEVPVTPASSDVLLQFEAGAKTQGNPRVMNLVEKATAFKLQTRALEEAEVGNTVAASRNLRSAATRLLNLGETDLAQAAEQEATQLEQQGKMSAAGTKKLTFATRKLTLDDSAVVESEKQ